MKTHRLRVRLREATCNAILEAAEAVAAREGKSGASLQAVAKEAGIAVGTIYNYFDDKEELFAAVFSRRHAELFEAIDLAAKKHAKDTFERQLDAFVRAVFTHFDARRAFLRLALDQRADLQLAKAKSQAKHPALRQLQERAEHVVRIGVRAKQLRSDENLDLLATVLVAIVRGVLMLRADSDQPLAAETERVVRLFLDGARK